MHDVHFGLHCPKGIHTRAVLDTGNHIRIRPRTDFPSFVAVADEPPVAVRTEANVMARFSPIGCNGETLVAGGYELDGAVEALRGQRDKAGTRRHLPLGAECATHEGTDDTHLFGVHREPLRDSVFQSIDELARLINRES